MLRAVYFDKELRVKCVARRGGMCSLHMRRVQSSHAHDDFLIRFRPSLARGERTSNDYHGPRILETEMLGYKREIIFLLISQRCPSGMRRVLYLKSLQAMLKYQLLIYFIATPPDRGWQRNEGLLLLHSFLSLDILVAFSILRFGKYQL